MLKLLVLFLILSQTINGSLQRRRHRISKVSKEKVLYFAYGSNLSTERMHRNNPSARRVGIGQLKGYKLDFLGYSNNWGGSPATIVPKAGSVVWGALWEINKSDLKYLDRQEGVGRKIYKPLTVKVITSTGKVVRCRTYRKLGKLTLTKNIEDIPITRQPSKDYLKTILRGAKESALPRHYQNWLKKIPSRIN